MCSALHKADAWEEKVLWKAEAWEEKVLRLNLLLPRGSLEQTRRIITWLGLGVYVTAVDVCVA